VANAERQVTALESRVNALRNDMAPMDAMQASREQQRRAALGQAIAELEQAKAAAARARQALDDLEDEARRKGALPGWLRE
jgi:CHASE3 domain sensor protein